MKITHTAFLTGIFTLLSFGSTPLHAGDLDLSKAVVETTPVDPWADTIRPISNPTHFESHPFRSRHPQNPDPSDLHPEPHARRG